MVDDKILKIHHNHCWLGCGESHSYVLFIEKYTRIIFLEDSFPSHKSTQRCMIV